MAERLGESNISAVASLLADPARATMLFALSDGRALPAGELARQARVAHSTASAHLAKLVDQGWLSVERCRRFRYFRLADPAIVRALEALAVVAPAFPVRSLRQADKAAAIRQARTCYDHLAGRLGVDLTATLVDRGILREIEDGYEVTPPGARALEDIGIGLHDAQRRRRLFAPHCPDWSERRHHLAGALGATLADRLFELGWIARVAVPRAVRVTEDGQRGLQEWLGFRCGDVETED